MRGSVEEGTKLFVPNKIQANLEIKGDLYVGPRAAYEGKQLTYKEAVEDADTVLELQLYLWENRLKELEKENLHIEDYIVILQLMNIIHLIIINIIILIIIIILL